MVFHKRKLTLTVNDSTMGSASADLREAITGQVVTLTITPAVGFRFKEFQCSHDIKIINNTFKMPNSDISINVVFEKIPERGCFYKLEPILTAGAPKDGEQPYGRTQHYCIFIRGQEKTGYTKYTGSGEGGRAYITGSEEFNKLVIRAEVEPDFTVILPSYCGSMFEYCQFPSLDCELFDMSNVTNTNNMFAECTELVTLANTGDWDISHITNVSSMFRQCTKLTTFDTTSWANNVITHMNYMFMDCSALTEISLNGIAGTHVEYAWSVFKNCINISKIKLQSLNLQGSVAALEFFYGCTSLQKIICPHTWTSTLSDIRHNSDIFTNCVNLSGAISYDANKTNIYYANLSSYFSKEII